MYRFFQLLTVLSRYREVDVSSRSDKVFTAILRLLQKHYMFLSEEANQLSTGAPLTKSSSLSKLDSFIGWLRCLTFWWSYQRFCQQLCSSSSSCNAWKVYCHQNIHYAASKHAESAHAGKFTTINHIRSDGIFFYSQGSGRISTLIHNCVQCSKLSGKTLT